MARLLASKRSKPKPTPRQARAIGWLFAAVALLITAGTWWFAGAVYSHQRSELAAFQATPVCAPSGASPTTAPCRRLQTAMVLRSARGGTGGGYIAVDLLPEPDHEVEARIVGHAPPPDGETVTIAWWHGQPALIQPQTPGRAPIPTEEGPQWGVTNDATGILVMLAFILGIGTGAWIFLTYYPMTRWRAAPVHLVAAALFAAVVTLRFLLHDYGALLTTAYVVPPVFLATAVGWWFLPFSRRISSPPQSTDFAGPLTL